MAVIYISLGVILVTILKEEIKPHLAETEVGSNFKIKPLPNVDYLSVEFVNLPVFCDFLQQYLLLRFRALDGDHIGLL